MDLGVDGARQNKRSPEMVAFARRGRMALPHLGDPAVGHRDIPVRQDSVRKDHDALKHQSEVSHANLRYRGSYSSEHLRRASGASATAARVGSITGAPSLASSLARSGTRSDGE